MSDIRIKDIPNTASEYADDDFLAMDGGVNGTRKIPVDNIAGAKVGMFGDAYDPTKTYPLSSYCIYDNTVYINISPVVSPEPFDSTKWEATNIEKELSKRYPVQRISADDYEDLSYAEKHNGTIYIILDEDTPEDTLIWDTIGRGTLEIGDDIIDGVNELNSALTNLHINPYSIITSQQVSTTEATYNTYDSRKFSDYDLLIFAFTNGTDDVRGTNVYPAIEWTSGKQIVFQALHGSSASSASSYSVSGLIIKYNSDTSVKASGGGANLINHFRIFGVKLGVR